MDSNGHTTTVARPAETVATKVTITVEAADALAAIRALEQVAAYDGHTETEILSGALLDAIKRLGKGKG